MHFPKVTRPQVLREDVRVVRDALGLSKALFGVWRFFLTQTKAKGANQGGPSGLIRVFRALVDQNRATDFPENFPLHPTQICFTRQPSEITVDF